jgi:hypothetical protein
VQHRLYQPPHQGGNHAQARSVAVVNTAEATVVGLTVVAIALCVVAVVEMSVALILFAVPSTLAGIGWVAAS